jgi:hypothetical protein
MCQLERKRSLAWPVRIHGILGAALMTGFGGMPQAAQAAGSSAATETFCYEKVTDSSSGRSTIYFTSIFLIPSDEIGRLLGPLAERMRREVAEQSPGARMAAEKPVCSFQRTESATQDLEETIAYYRRDPTATIRRLSWERSFR